MKPAPQCPDPEGYHTLGSHLLVEVWGARKLSEPHFIEDMLVRAADACGATLLNVQMHHFGDGQGVTGVALLAESHISIHTWPEHDYAALDIFVCGAAKPGLAVPVIESDLAPSFLQISEHKRGILIHSAVSPAEAVPAAAPEAPIPAG